MRKILIVDDRPINRQFLTTLLGYDGHQLLEACDGAEAIEQARRHHPDLVITDIVMPTMDGYELVHQLRADPHLACTPVIFYTAHCHHEQAAALARACGCRLLIKPAEPEQILRCVREVLGQAAQPSPAATPVPESFDREHLQLLTNTLAEKVDELRQAREVAEVSLTQLRAVFTYMTDGLILCDAQGNITALNPAALAIHGLAPDYDARRPLQDYRALFLVYDLEGNALPFERWPVSRAMAGEQFGGCEVRVRRVDTGHEFIGSYSGLSVPTTSGEQTLIIVTVRDITAQKQAQEAMRQSERRFRGTFENAAVGITHMAPDGRWLQVNRTFCEILGCSREELLARTALDLTCPEDREPDLSRFAVMMRGEIDRYTLEKRYLHRDGHVVWTSVMRAIQRDEAGRPLYAISVIQDISERKRAEAALRDSELLNRSLVNSSMDCIKTLDLEGRLLSISGGGQRLLEIDNVGEYLNTPWVNFWQEDDRPRVCQAVATAREGGVGRFQAFCPSASGKPLWWDVIITLLPSQDGRPERLLAVSRDVTEQKRIEEQLAAAKRSAEQANQAKDHFLAVLSHELRTPLTPVLTTASLLGEDPELPECYREDVEMIRRNVELEARLIDDLLDVTRIVRGKLELDRKPVALCEIIRRAVEVCQPDIEARRLHFGVDIGPDSPYLVEADAARLQQVFWNLLKNAIKFTPHDGCVGVRCLKRDGHVVVEVNDSGEGIDPAKLPHIFNPFEQGGAGITRQFGGLGLGLTITKGLVEMHGGSVEAHSEGKGKGASFKVRLPLASRPSTKTERKPPVAAAGRPVAAAFLQILLVEDHGDTAKIMKRLLNAAGHQVQTAGDVATGLELAGSQPFDLLISDLGLPDGSGIDLMRELRQRGSKLPAIALSGYGQEEDIRRSKEAGFAAHLTKPTSLDRLAEAIAAVAGQTITPSGERSPYLACDRPSPDGHDSPADMMT